MIKFAGASGGCRLDEFAQFPPYIGMAGDTGAHVRLKLDTDEPIALTDFVGTFVGLSNQFDKFVAAEHPGVKMESEFFVKEVRAGCVEADLVALVMPLAAANALPGMIDVTDKVQVLQKFVIDIGAAIMPYFTVGGRNPEASRSDLNDFHKAVSAIARDPQASGKLEAAEYVDGERKVCSTFKFSSAEARIAQREIAEQKAEMDAKSDVDYTRASLRFVRPSVEQGKPGKPGGERGIIDRIHPRAIPILYASDMAEQRMKFKLQQAEGNAFRKLFDVDVNVELTAGGRPRAYRIVALHQVLNDVSDED